MKIAETIERFMRRALKAKLCQQTFIKKRPRRLDTPHLIFKSHKTMYMYSEQRSLKQFLSISFSCLFSLFATVSTWREEHFPEKTNHMHGLTEVSSDARRCNVPYTARKTVTIELQANRGNVLAIQITDLK